MDLINRNDLLHHLDECIAEGDAQTPITNAVLLAVKCAVAQMPRVEFYEDAAKTIEAMGRDLKSIGDCTTCRYYSADGFHCGYKCGKCQDKCRCYLCVGSSLYEWRGANIPKYEEEE